MPVISSGKRITSAAQLATDVVGADEIQANAVGASEIATDAVDAAEIAADAVRASEIQADAVGSSELADNAVDSGAITDGAIVNADINTSAAIVDSKLAQITTAGKVSGAALTSLGSIPSNAGTIPAANVASSFGQLDNVSTGGTVASLTTNTLSAKKWLRLHIFIKGWDVNDSAVLRFNGDSGTNYDFNFGENGGAATEATGQAQIKLTNTTSTGITFWIIDIINIATENKLVLWQGIRGNVNCTGVASWLNTSNQITSVTLKGRDDNSLLAGASITVFGMD